MSICCQSQKRLGYNKFNTLENLCGCFHTAGVTGSIPVPSTSYARVGTNRGRIIFDPYDPNQIALRAARHPPDSSASTP